MSIHQQKTTRFSFDIPVSMHKNIKLACVEDAISMNACMIKALERWYEERTEKQDEAAYLEGMKDVEEGNIRSLEDVKRDLGLRHTTSTFPKKQKRSSQSSKKGI
jgi:predicted transcriptional regulator